MTRTPRPVAFTLLEVVLTIAIMSLMMVGLTSAVLIASHAAPEEDSDYVYHLESERVLQSILGELETALWVTEQTATSITFTVPDRSGDNLPERIRYAWSGDSTKLLERTYNGTTATILTDVTTFGLEYRTGAVTEDLPGAVIVGNETVVSVHVGDRNNGSHAIENGNAAGFVFTPILPANTTNWQPTRLRLMVRSDGAQTGTSTVSLNTTYGGGWPDVPISSFDIYEGDLTPNFAWYEGSLLQRNLEPNTAYAVTVDSGDFDFDAAMEVQTQTNVNTGFSGSFLGQDLNNMNSSKRMLHELYGIPITQAADVTVTRNYLRDVAINLQVGTASETAVQSARYLRNVPEQLAGFWELDFAADPQLDHNGDGVGDWTDLNDSFSTSSLTDGAWGVDSILETGPDNDFAGLTTVELDFETFGVGAGAFLYLPIDVRRDFSAINITLGKELDGSQSIELEHQTDDSTFVRLAKETELPSGPVRVRLVIDPTTQTINMTINEDESSSFQYSRYDSSTVGRRARIGTAGASADFYRVMIRTSP